MDCDVPFVFDGRKLTADDIRKLLADAPLLERQAKVLEHVEGATILDIGCFTGIFVREASRRYPERTVIGVDRDDESLRICHLLNPQLSHRFRRMSAYQLEFADASIDCITVQETLEHLEGAAVAVKEFNRVLRPGGVLIVTVPNPYYIGRILRFCASEIGNSFRRWRRLAPRLKPEVFDPQVDWDRHVLSFTPQTLLALCCVNGFAYVLHAYENGMPAPARWALLGTMPFLGPTLILKVRKIADASPRLV
jgi:SAM-dependent methyltransferase